MEIKEKIKQMRKAEGHTQEAFCDETGIAPGTLKNMEQGVSSPKFDQILQIFKHEQYRPYALWLITGDIAPEYGQISPDMGNKAKLEARRSVSGSVPSDSLAGQEGDRFNEFIAKLNKLTAEYMD